MLKKRYIDIINRILPRNTKRREVAKKIYNLFKQKNSINIKKNGFLIQRNDKKILLPLSYITNKKIAIHIHLFYIDLLDEFYCYLLNIHHNFDLYVSVPDTVTAQENNKILSQFRKIRFLKFIKLSKVPNVGRDSASMFITFREDLRKYDYLLHIHTKKSLRTGSDQSEWRKYLLDNLIGSPNLVDRYIYVLENYNYDAAFPDFFEKNCSRVSMGVLSEKQCMHNFYKKLNLQMPKYDYLLFSAGNMFWCKPKMYNDVFNANLTWDDFTNFKDAESGLEYVLERITDALCKKRKTSIAVYDATSSSFYENRSNQLENELRKITKEKVLNQIKKFDRVSFDIFDTLITRCIDNPDDIFLIIDHKIQKKYGLKKGQFYQLRKDAEKAARYKIAKDNECNIDEIYNAFQTISKLKKTIIEDIKNIEIETDLFFLIPRRDSLDLYNSIKQMGIKIDIVSDMYYTEKILSKFLKKCGFSGWDNLIVSSYVRLRKDNGKLWDWYYEKLPKQVKHIHIGDNLESDVHKLWMKGRYAYHLPSSKNLYDASNFNKNEYFKNIENSILKGLVFNKCIFNSPFSLSCDSIVDNLHDLGYSIFGPICLNFMIWLSKETKGKTLFFVSREGYYLQKIYNEIIKLSNAKTKQNSFYFLTSRRASTVPNISNSNDIKQLIYSYNGNVYDFFNNRFGIVVDTSYKKNNINLPKDNDIVIKISKKYEKQIFNRARKEKEGYLQYIKRNNFELDKNSYIVDLGYSGTAQFELSKMLNTRISGAYFALNHNVKPLKLNCIVKSCYKKMRNKDNAKAAFPYSFMLESFLTSNKGQLINFNSMGNPLFQTPQSSHFQKTQIVYNGVINFIRDFASLTPKKLLELSFDKNLIIDIYYSFGANLKLIKNDCSIIDFFELEDFYYQNKIVKYNKSNIV